LYRDGIATKGFAANFKDTHSNDAFPSSTASSLERTAPLLNLQRVVWPVALSTTKLRTKAIRVYQMLDLVEKDGENTHDAA